MNNANPLKTRIDALLNVLSEDVLVISQSGEIIFASGHNGALPWGNTDELSGKNLEQIFPVHIAFLLKGMVEQALSLNQVASQELLIDPQEVPYMQEQGLKNACWIEARMAPSAGDEPSVVCRIEDISERKKAARERSKVQRDLLTGMYNYRALMPVLAQSMAQAVRYDWVCSLMVINIDSLAAIKDSHGWDVGDQILRRLAESLNSLKRTADFLARVGEDGFAILLPETNEEQGQLAAQRVQRMVAELAGPDAATDIEFTVSIGVATLKDDADTAEEMFARAEEALHRAKQAGNSRIGSDA